MFKKLKYHWTIGELVTIGVFAAAAKVITMVVALAGGADIAVDDNLAVDRNLDAVTLNADLLGVPLSQLGRDDTLGGDDAVDRTVYLILAQVCVDRVVMVEDLDLHTVVCGILAHLGTYAHTVVHAGAVEAELEAQHEILILLLAV